MNNCLLKFIMFIENLLCVYRNYTSFSITKKIMVSLRMAIEIILILTITAIYVSSDNLDYTEINKIVYFCLNTTFSLLLILLAVYKSKKFKNLVNYLEKTHKYFSEDEIYVKNIIRKPKIIRITIIVNLIFFGSIWLYILYLNGFPDDKTFFLLVVVLYGICEIRYVFEYIVVYDILAVLSEQVKSITRSIFKDTETVIPRQVHEMEIEIIRNIEYFSKWTRLYKTLKDSSNLINDVFGLQISVILTIATFYNIILCYNSVANYLVVTHMEIVYETYRVITYTIALFVLCRGAHTTQNSVEELKQKLAGTLIRSTADQEVYKIIRDFFRLITNQPMETQAFGSVTINMSFVPKMIMFFTSYTVIALQFNNVM